jgi:hypothetical protein
MFTHHQLETAQDALMVASAALSVHADDLRAIAEQIRAGNQVFPFTDGEPGAEAADYLAADKAYRAQKFDDLYQAIDDILYP